MRVVLKRGSEKVTTRSVGRPRSAQVERDALAAVRALLVEAGYSALTLSAVAQRAGTTTAALYRRWPSLAHLVYDATFPADLALRMPAESEPYAWLFATISGARDLLCDPVVVAAVPGLMSEFAARPELHSTLISRFSASVFDEIGTFLRKAAEDGILDPQIEPYQLIESIVGAVLTAALIHGELDDAWAAGLARLLWKGITA
jgi:AcrR family transcriptional regulator